MERYLRIVLFCSFVMLKLVGYTQERDQFSLKYAKIVQDISNAPTMILSETGQLRGYLDGIYAQIDAITNRRDQVVLYSRFMKSACSTSFDGIGDLSSTNNIERRSEICRRLSNGYSCLKHIVDEIWSQLFISGCSASDQFSFWFMLIQKLKAESARLKNENITGLNFAIKSTEIYYHFYFLRMKITPFDSQDCAHVCRAFEEVVGRPMRTREELIKQEGICD